jgi:hypothetical protein
MDATSRTTGGKLLLNMEIKGDIHRSEYLYRIGELIRQERFFLLDTLYDALVITYEAFEYKKL